MGYGDKDGYGEKGHGKNEKHDHCHVCAVSCMTHGKTQVEVEIMNYMMMGNKMDMGMDMDKEMGSGMMGGGMIKPEGEWEKPEGEMSGSGMMGMKERKTWMQRTLGEVKKCHMKCMKQEEMHEFVENMC